MAGRYKGYFTDLDGHLYRVEIEKSGSTGDYTEVAMAYNEPFVTTWESDENPFAPSRKCTAKMKFIHTSYMDDSFPNNATETSVRLIEDSTGNVKWQGFLKPNVYDMGFEKEDEELSLDASDAIAALQYRQYKSINHNSNWDGSGMATVYGILKNIFRDLGISKIYWAQDKRDADGNFLYPTDIVISEKNFYSSDNNEAWKCDEVLDEICKYIGVTAMQVEDAIYLIDFSEYKTHSMISFLIYDLSDDSTTSLIQGIEAYADTPEAYMLNGADISFSPAYNKATVKASLYTPDNVLPDMFSSDENDVTYRLGDSSKIIQAKRPTYPFKYTNKKGEEKTDSDDATFAFPIKLLDCKGWESWYYSANTDGSFSYKVLSENEYNSESAVTQYIGGTIIDRAQVKASHKYYDVAGTPDFDRALFLRTDGRMVEDAEFGYDDWLGDEWQKQVSGMCQYVISGDTLDKYNTLFSTFGNYSLGCPGDSGDTYLVMNVSAMWERYPQPYVNSEWSSNATGYFSTKIHTWQYPPVLNFILSCGSQYYNGKEWQSTRCGFRIPLEHSTEDKVKKVDGFDETFAVSTGDDWNSEKKSFNNILWTNWSTDKGFKISLKGLNDRSGLMYLSFLTPNSIVGFRLINSGQEPEDVKNVYRGRGYKIDGGVWITSFSLTMARDGSPAEDTDIVYENVIDIANVNELEEVTFKINTAVKGSKPSYSFVEKATGGWFTGWKQTSTGSEMLCPEEQWIQKQVEHFSVPRREIKLTLSTDVLPYGRVHEGWTGKEYAVTGTEIDYSNCRQTITMKEMN